MAEQAPFYIFTAFIFAYAVGTLAHVARPHPDRGAGRLRASRFVTIPLSGHISDRIGRRKMYLIGAARWACSASSISACWTPRSRGLVFIAIVLSLIPHDMQYGPQAALIAEAFTPRLRYSGASLGYQLASIIAGGPAPLIATALFAAFHSGYAIAIYIAACAVVSLSPQPSCPTTRVKIFRWNTTRKSDLAQSGSRLALLQQPMSAMGQKRTLGVRAQIEAHARSEPPRGVNAGRAT